ncbi:splicing regulator SDE2 [Linepithema humile]|uniref:splicing regulator SDE2 n=1 Tax=Linepithema humile TaxID=83485 RepID=UPI00351F0373
MLNIKIAGASERCVFKSDAPLTVHELRKQIEDTIGFSCNEYYILQNGRLLQDDAICSDGDTTVVPRLLGGKGGFGSMLRAIGAQIEKTTNREACRDLSGRRLRDINEEKRLKSWIEKQTKREKEAAERKKKKLEKLCAEPRHEFQDQRYEQERAELTERVGDAVEEGFKAAGPSGIKRQLEEDFKPNKRKTILDLDIDSDEFESSDFTDDSESEEVDHDSLFIKEDEGETSKQEKLNDNGHISNDENVKKVEDKPSESI